MPTAILHSLTSTDLESLDSLDVLQHALDLLPQSRTAYDDAGDEAGLVYFDDASGCWYAADIEDCARLVSAHVMALRTGEGEPAARVRDVYSLWCAATTPIGSSGSDADDAAADAGWTL